MDIEDRIRQSEDISQGLPSGCHATSGLLFPTAYMKVKVKFPGFADKLHITDKLPQAKAITNSKFLRVTLKYWCGVHYQDNKKTGFEDDILQKSNGFK
jgi:hypothetical protein